MTTTLLRFLFSNETQLSVFPSLKFFGEIKVFVPVCKALSVKQTPKNSKSKIDMTVNTQRYISISSCLRYIFDTYILLFNAIQWAI